MARFKASRLASAKAALRKSLRIDADDSMAHYWMGRALHAEGLDIVMLTGDSATTASARSNVTEGNGALEPVAEAVAFAEGFGNQLRKATSKGRVRSDIQRTAYILKPGETEPPAAIQRMWKTAREATDKAIAAMRPGVTGKDVIVTLCGLYNQGEVLNGAVARSTSYDFSEGISITPGLWVNEVTHM